MNEADDCQKLASQPRTHVTHPRERAGGTRTDKYKGLPWTQRERERERSWGGGGEGPGRAWKGQGVNEVNALHVTGTSELAELKNSPPE